MSVGIYLYGMFVNQKNFEIFHFQYLESPDGILPTITMAGNDRQSRSFGLDVWKHSHSIKDIMAPPTVAYMVHGHADSAQFFIADRCLRLKVHAVRGACVLYMSMLMWCLCSIYEHAHVVLVFYI